MKMSNSYILLHPLYCMTTSQRDSSNSSKTRWRQTWAIQKATSPTRSSSPLVTSSVSSTSGTIQAVLITCCAGNVTHFPPDHRTLLLTLLEASLLPIKSKPWSVPDSTLPVWPGIEWKPEDTARRRGDKDYYGNSMSAHRAYDRPSTTLVVRSTVRRETVKLWALLSFA